MGRVANPRRTANMPGDLAGAQDLSFGFFQEIDSSLSDWILRTDEDSRCADIIVRRGERLK